MAGINTVSGQESILFVDNASFDGTTRSGAMTSDGQLWIGSTALPHVKKGTLTAGTGITVTNGSGSISIATTAAVQTTGTFSPTLTGSTTNPTVVYEINNGIFTKIGRFVFINASIQTDAYSGGSGQLRVAGLPFTSMSGTGINTNAVCVDSITFTGNIAATVFPNASHITFATSISGPGLNFLSTSAWGATASFNATIEYCS